MTDDERLWERGWDGHERAQRRRLAALSLAEKLRWLEDADRLVRHLRKETARAPRLSPGSGERLGKPGSESAS